MRNRFATRFPEGSVADDRGRHRFPQHRGTLSIGALQELSRPKTCTNVVQGSCYKLQVSEAGGQGSCLTQGAKFHVAGSFSQVRFAFSADLINHSLNKRECQTPATFTSASRFSNFSSLRTRR